MTDLLRQRLARHLAGLFDQCRVVVWEDHSGALGPLLREALPESVQMPPFDGNPLSLRQALDVNDPWLEQRWLLYVPPLPAGVEAEWLADFEQGFRHQPQASLAWALREFFGLPETSRIRGLLKGPAAARLADQFHRYFGEGVDRLSDEDVLFALMRAAIEAPEADEGELVLRFLTLESGLADPSRRERLLAVLEAQIEGSDLVQALDDPLKLASAPALPFLDDHMQWLLLQQEPRDRKGQTSWWERITSVADARLRQPQGAYQSPRVLPQTRFWSDLVDTGGRAAVLIIDALRADLAWSLAERLRRSHRQIEARTALAELPTRTEVGMAALLPQAQEGFAVRVEQGARGTSTR